ncbi:hypothetical protein T459_30856, partial [Capsicum annuum]
HKKMELLKNAGVDPEEKLLQSLSTTLDTTTAPMTTPKKSFGRRSSLLDKMLDEDYEMGSHMTNRRPGLLLSTVRALDNVGLDIQQVVISYFNGFAFEIFRAETNFILNCRELYSNNIEGKIPKELGNVENLVSMDLYGNKFEGNIPKSFAKLKSLRFLRLNDNKLIGSIPRELTTLPNLKVLDVSHNDLCGTIPVDGPFESFPMEGNIFSLNTATEFQDTSLLIFFLLYCILGVITVGIVVPSGLFIQIILMGSGYGRLLGIAMRPYTKIDQGLYVVLGAASLMAGSTRMTSIYKIMSELKGLPFLEAHPEPWMRNITVGELAGVRTPVVTLHEIEKGALNENSGTLNWQVDHLINPQLAGESPSLGSLGAESYSQLNRPLTNF